MPTCETAPFVPRIEFGEEKMTQGWVVYGGIRHAELQKEMFSRSYGTMYLNVRATGLTNDCHYMRAFLCHLPNPPGLICINTFILSRTKPPVLGYNSIQVCSCYVRHAGLDFLLRWLIFNTKVLEDLYISNRHCGPHPSQL